MKLMQQTEMHVQKELCILETVSGLGLLKLVILILAVFSTACLVVESYVTSQIEFKITNIVESFPAA